MSDSLSFENHLYPPAIYFLAKPRGEDCIEDGIEQSRRKLPTILLSVDLFAGTWQRSMKIAWPLCLRAGSGHDGADCVGTQPVSHVGAAITYGHETRNSVRGSLAENNKNPLTCRESQEAFGFAPRHAERIKLFTFDTYTKSIVEVSTIDKMNDGYMAPNVPPTPYRSYKSSLAEPAIFNVADTLRAASLSSFPSFALSSKHGDRQDKIVPVRQIRENGSL